MSELVEKVLVELIRATDAAERPPLFARARLLRQAAVLIEVLRERIGFQDGDGAAAGLVEELNVKADTVDLQTWSEVNGLILRARSAIEALQRELDRTMDRDYENLIDDLNANLRDR